MLFRYSILCSPCGLLEATVSNMGVVGGMKMRERRGGKGLGGGGGSGWWMVDRVPCKLRPVPCRSRVPYRIAPDRAVDAISGAALRAGPREAGAPWEAYASAPGQKKRVFGFADELVEIFRTFFNRK